MFMLKWQVNVVILPRSTDGMVQVTSASKGKGTEKNGWVDKTYQVGTGSTYTTPITMYNF